MIGATAARAELDLNQRDFELAVQLGEVRAVTAAATPGTPDRLMVPRAELDRLTAEPGFPDAFHARLRLVGTVTGADLLGISRDRFTRLARAGCFRPARWYLNRYRALVWLYPVAEVTAFADENPGRLTGRLPEEVRERLDDGLDLRARGWRARRVGQLVERAPDAWHEAAVWVALLGPDQAADLLTDRHDRARLTEFRPSLLTDRPVSRTDEEPSPGVPLTADDPEEIAAARSALAAALRRAERAEPAPAPPRRCGTVTRRGQRWPWPRGSLPLCGPRDTRRGPRRTGERTDPPAVRPT